MSDPTHSGAAEAHDHGHGHDHAGHNKIYFVIGAALLVGTIVTVLARYWEFNSVALTVAVALLIASIKAFLVAGYFMHLLSEKKLVYGVLVLSAIFFVALMGLTLWGSNDLPRNSTTKTLYVP